IRPRTDIALINAMMKVILDAGLVDLEYVNAHTDGWPALSAHLATVDVTAAASECGIAEAVLRDAALAFGRASRGFIGWTMGVNHSVQGTETVTLLNDLALITGNIGRPGAAPFSITGQCNAMGTREAGGTASLPGYRRFDVASDRASLAALWDVPVDLIPTERGRAYPDIIDGIVDGTINGLWVIATNPPVSFPNRRRLEKALGDLDLLVVQDGFETPTTALAHVVLPAAIWGEKDGTYTNSERRVCRVRRAVDPPGSARSDFDIFLAVAARLGLSSSLFPGWVGPEDAFSEWGRVSAGRLCDYSGITYSRIDAAGGVQWPCSVDTEAPGGTPRLYADGRFPTDSGRAQLRVVVAQALTEAPDAAFPFLLNTGRTVEHWHTRTKTGRVGVLDEMAPAAWVEVNPADAVHLHLVSGDRVRVTSVRGSVDGLAVRVSATVREGEVFIPFHYDEQCVNLLTIDEFDPTSREPNYKQCAVRLDRL
ncbi:MAG TPA: molybdopterin oxidoreductase family protein, partial [Acidimicrobiales bacterium]|nr:molybdopterin oxidoreductase family protein [Acidimicrobiales bacterium]